MRRKQRTLRTASSQPVQGVECPECGERFMLYGDPLDVLTAEWALRAGDDSFTPGEDVRTVAGHEHDPWRFIEKRSGLPFGEVTGGTGYGRFSEPAVAG